MRAILSERNLVVILFVTVFITFALAHEDSKKMEQVYIGFNSTGASNLVSLTPSHEKLTPADHKAQPVRVLQ